MDFAEKMCDHIAIIHNGRMLVSGSLTELKSEYSLRNVSLVYEGDISFLEGNPIVEKMEDFGRFTGIKVSSPDDVQKLLHLLVEHNIIVKKFDANDISLHEIFINLTGNPEEDEGEKMSVIAKAPLGDQNIEKEASDV